MPKRLALSLLALLPLACATQRPLPKLDDFTLLNPLLRTQPKFEFKELHPFSYKIKALIEERKLAGHVELAAVYFRDLENGPLRGINYEEKFTPASLLKVPLILAAFHHMEKDAAFGAQRVKLDIPYRGQSYLSTRALFPGEEYSVDEIIRALAIHSDNDALVLLRSVVPQQEQDEVYRDFGLIIPDVRGIDDSMTIREYATFFRVLYNASYLSKTMSQKALALFAQSAYVDGIVAGVPPGIVVAHKYGERFYAEGDKRQLHDCGIVYHPKKHYNLCVMTRGKNFTELAGVIREISRLVYREVSARDAAQ